MGRCPVRSIFPEALEVMARNQHKFGYVEALCVVQTIIDQYADRAVVYSFMYDKIMPLAEAVEGYDLFDNMKVQKVIFTP